MAKRFAKHKIQKTMISLDKLTPEEKEILGQELYLIHSKIFSGVTIEHFFKYVINNTANVNCLEVYKNNNETIGYMAVHRYDLAVESKKIHIFRFESGVLHEYRGLNLQYGIIFKTVVSFVLRHPFSRYYFLGTLIHPSSYCGFSNHFKKIYPNLRGDLPDHIKRLIPILRNKFNLDHPFPDYDWVTTVGWITRDTKAEKIYWQNTTKPAALFFQKLNPYYGQGYGLITIIQIDYSGILHSIKARIKKLISPLFYRAANISPKLMQWLYRQQIKQQLLKIALFQAKDINQLIKDSYPIFVPRGSFLFEQGEASNGLYILISGSVFVLMKNQGQDLIIDQISENNVIGEIGSLTKIPRTASIRTATHATFIKISQHQINQVLTQITDDQINTFKKLGIRLLENYLNMLQNQPAWIKLNINENAVNCIKLAKDETMNCERPSDIFLFVGFVEMKNQDQTLLSINGQALVKFTTHQTLHAIQDSFILMLDSALLDQLMQIYAAENKSDD